jgi:outer membrane protein assembly factor BamB
MRRISIAARFLILAAPIALAANWPQWRGPSADGISLEKSVPVEWSAEKNIAWKIPLAGLGTSTPIVWGDRIFLTAQIGDGPYEGRSRDFENASVARRTGERDKVRFVVQAISRRDGSLLWEYKFDADGFMQPVHIKHNMASPSCVTDGEFVYAWMGTGQLVALTLDGKEVWKRHLGKDYGPFEILWGHGSSPTIYRNTLILLCDHQGQAYLLSLDKKNGKQIWKVERGKDRRSYSTPFVIPGPHGDELIVNSSERIDAFDPVTGKPLWHVGEENRVPVPTPVFHNGILYTSRGYSSGPYMALTPAGKVLWEVKTGAPYVSSLLYYEGLLYMATETGIASCVDAATGKTLWKERFGGVFSASPVAANGKVYLINEGGEAFVLEAGRELKILHKNVLAERTLASPAVSGGQIFLRTDEHLIAIGNPALSAQGN